MSSKIDKLWKDSWFQQQNPITKLLYIYLLESSDLSIVGAFSPNPNIICLELDITIDQLRESTQVLVAKKWLWVKSIEGVLYFVVPQHFKSVPKSTNSLERIQKALSVLPDELVDVLRGLGIDTESKVRTFVKPTAQEVTEYALSQGYLINGKEFVDYYDGTTSLVGKTGIWVDGRGTEVRDWKAKLRKIWCKEEKKIKSCPDAPKGYETFHVFENGVMVTPDGWRNGQPFSKSLTSDIILKREYGREINNSTNS